jgi:hypothetical protein
MSSIFVKKVAQIGILIFVHFFRIFLLTNWLAVWYNISRPHGFGDKKTQAFQPGLFLLNHEVVHSELAVELVVLFLGYDFVAIGELVGELVVVVGTADGLEEALGGVGVGVSHCCNLLLFFVLFFVLSDCIIAPNVLNVKRFFQKRLDFFQAFLIKGDGQIEFYFLDVKLFFTSSAGCDGLQSLFLGGIVANRLGRPIGFVEIPNVENSHFLYLLFCFCSSFLLIVL